MDTSKREDTYSHSLHDCGIFLKAKKGEPVIIAKKRILRGVFMTTMEIPVEFKPHKTQYTFSDCLYHPKTVPEEVAGQEADISHPSSTHKFTNSNMKHRGQQIDYVAQIMSRQHRTHVLSISIIGHNACIIRWDRSGAVISEAFDYAETNYLSEFLFRYEHATTQQRGHNTTTQVITDHEASMFDQGVKTYIAGVPEHMKKLFWRTLSQLGPAWKLCVPNPSADTHTEYIVRRPFVDATSSLGRATRAYLAWSCSANKLVFLKDMWRPNVPDILSESSAYAKLAEQHVPHLPTVLASSDLYNSDGSVQCTLTQDAANDPKLSQGRPLAWIILYHHSRTAQELADPLQLMRNSKQLAQAVRDVLESAHCQQAFFRVFGGSYCSY